MRSLWLFLLLVYSVVDALAQSPDGFVPVAEPEASQILKELNAKWDADLASIVSIEVQYQRCAISVENVKKITHDEVTQWVQPFAKNNQNLFELIYDLFLNNDSFTPIPNSTITLRDQLVSRDIFRFCGDKLWGQMIHPGGFVHNGQTIPDMVDYFYIDSEKYKRCTTFNKDAKIGNQADFRLDFGNLVKFFQQPVTRVFWNDPKIFRSKSDPNTLIIEASDGTFRNTIDRDRGIMLQFTEIYDDPQMGLNFVHEQIFAFDFFSPAKGLWFPRTVLSVFYEPKIVAGRFEKNGIRPSIVYFHTIEDIKINEEMPDSAFHVPAPRGTVVWDYRESREDPFFAQATEEDISDIVTWIDAQKNPSLPEPPRFYNHPIALVISFVIITLFLVFLFRFYWNRKMKRC